MRRAANCLVTCIAAAAAAACFRGDFLDDTCERLPDGCPVLTTGGDVSTTAEPTTAAPPDLGCVPDPQEPAIIPPPDGELQPGPGFRITKLQIVDPSFYFSLGNACLPVSGTIGDAVTRSLAIWETNLVFLADDYDPDAPSQTIYFLRDVTCDQNANYCAFDAASLGIPFTVINEDEGDCRLPVAPNSADPEDIMRLGAPIAPCFRSPAASIGLSLIPGEPPLELYFARFAAKYDRDDCNPTDLVQGALMGFIKREDAMAAEYEIDDYDVTVNLWQLILGSDTNTCELAIDKQNSVDAVSFRQPNNTFELSFGAYIYLNIEAERLPVYRRL